MSDEIDIGLLAESFAEFLGGEWPREKAVAYARETNLYDADLWDQVAQLGWPALTVPEASGGLGLGTEAAFALHAALGAAAAPLPMLGTTLASALLAAAGSAEQQASLLPGLADGSSRAAVALDSAPLTADASTISGVVADVLDAPAASLLVLPVTRAGKGAWLVVRADAPGVSIERFPLADTTRTLGTITLAGVAIDPAGLIVPADAAATHNLLQREAALAIAADAIGGGEAVLATTIEYMRGREQFDRVIASFQALKHRVADHQCALVGARTLVEYAAGLPADHPEALLYALSAKQHITRATAEIARDCIQLHGGVGFTAEYVPHIYLKRAKLNEALFGTRAVLLDQIADMLEAA